MASRICNQDDCDRPVRARGMCTKHYQAYKRLGLALPDVKKRKRGTCSEPGCGAPHSAGGLCRSHYGRRQYRDRVGRPVRETIRNGEHCSEPGCDLHPTAKGLCRGHYNHARHRARVGHRRLKPRQVRVCSEEGCSAKHRANSLCDRHYQRSRTSPTTRVVQFLHFDNECFVRDGWDRDLEAQALLLLTADGTKAEDRDWLTPGELIGRQKLEVYNSLGFPDPEIVEGRVFRAYNPLFGKRPGRYQPAAA